MELYVIALMGPHQRTSSAGAGIRRFRFQAGLHRCRFRAGLHRCRFRAGLHRRGLRRRGGAAAGAADTQSR